MAEKALLWQELSGKNVQCQLCSHYCKISPGRRGICRARENRDGTLVSLVYGRPTSIAIDPIEKKPFFHFRPGTTCLSFGTLGCNMKCQGCQNWDISQATAQDSSPMVPSEQIVETGFENNCDGFAYTYNEPTIFFEYWRDVVLACRKKETELGVPEAGRKYHVAVSNGFFSREFWQLVEKEKLLDAIRIDLKSFRNEFYQRFCSARLEPVLENIKRVYESKIPLEIITLVIPGENDSDEELSSLANWLAGISKEIPLHFSRFHPDYKATDRRQTPEETLANARRIGLDAGLKYVYVGNAAIPGTEDTFCPKCGEMLVARRGFSSQLVGLEEKGRSVVCKKCGEKIPVVP